MACKTSEIRYLTFTQAYHPLSDTQDTILLLIQNLFTVLRHGECSCHSLEKSHCYTRKNDPNYFQEKSSGKFWFLLQISSFPSHSWAISHPLYHISLNAHEIFYNNTRPTPYYNTHRTNIDLPLPPSTSTVGHRQPAYQASAAWNQLPVDIR